MFGEVAWMNSLTNQFYGAWQVRPYPEHGNPYIVAITESQSEICLKLPEIVTQKPIERHPELPARPSGGVSGSLDQPADVFDDLLTPVRGQQLTLF